MRSVCLRVWFFTHHIGSPLLAPLGLARSLARARARLQDHRDRMVRESVMLLLPKLAAFAPEPFVRGYLGTCLSHIIATLKKAASENAVNTAFVALGEMALAVGEHVVPKLDVIVALVKDGLASRNRKSFANKVRSGLLARCSIRCRVCSV